MWTPSKPLAAATPRSAAGAEDPHEELSWAAEVEQVLLRYRQSFDYEAERDARSARALLRRPFGILEMAFQSTCQVMVPLLVPRTHAFLRYINCQILRQTDRQALPQPLLAIFSSSLQAKLLLDLANLLEWPPFGWVDLPELRPAPEEMLHPLSLHCLEFNVMNASIGVALGRLLVAIKEGLRSVLPSGSGWLRPGPAAVASCVFGSVSYLATTLVLSHCVVLSLSSLLTEAQVTGRSLTATAARSLYRSLGLLLRLSLAAGSPDDPVWWEGADDEDDIPHDFHCPITRQVFVRPVLLHGEVFEGYACRKWVAANSRHPTLQGLHCHVGEIRPAREMEELCRRLAAVRGWRLRTAGDRPRQTKATL